MWIEAKPEINEPNSPTDIKDRSIVSGGVSRRRKNVAPKIAGIASKKENEAASFQFIPN